LFGEAVGLEVGQDYVEDIAQSHNMELTIDDLHELGSCIENPSGEEDQDQNDFIHNSEIKEIWHRVGDSEGIDLRTYIHRKRDLLLYSSQDKWIS
jgi:hypothetical protein